jgi:deazaflavin-dependent oxidoreductase (nitroreductase family)
MSQKSVQRIEQKENDMKILERVQKPNKISVQAPAIPPKRIIAATNVIVRFLLRSPLHFLLSNTMMLLTYTGRKSGKRYTNPLPYQRERDVVTVFTQHSWWKNVRACPKVAAEIKRQRMSGIAEVISDDTAAIAASLLAFLRKHPAQARWYNVPLDADGQPDSAAVQQAAHFVVMVRIHLASPHSSTLPA